MSYVHRFKTSKNYPRGINQLFSCALDVPKGLIEVK
jgi:hypothetical protein